MCNSNTMAIYCRNTGNLSSSLMLCCSKYSNVTHNFHVLQQRAAKTFGNSQRYCHFNSKNRMRKNDNEDSSEKDLGSLLDIVYEKKALAKKSLLVHLKAKQNIQELHSMCSNFGRVENMYQYETDDNQNFVLMEFQTAKSLKGVKSFVKEKTQSLVQSCIFNFHGSNAQNRSTKHMPLVQHPRKSDTMQLNKLKQIAAGKYSMTTKIMAHYNLMKLNTLDEKLRYFVLCQIEEAISSINSNIKVIPFGSTVNGFGKYNSDLDLVLINELNSTEITKNIEKPYLTIGTAHTNDRNANSRTKLKTSLHLIATIIPRTVPGIINMSEILSARVPIIRFKHQPTDLSCDLTMDQRAGICMSELLHIFGTFDLRLRPLVLFIRNWARMRQLTSPHPSQRITNFSLSLLLIFYFQTKRLLPSLQLLTMYARYCDIMHGDDGKCYSFLRRPELLPAIHLHKTDDSLEKLLLGFFEYYADFNFNKFAVCLQNGQPQINDEVAPIVIRNPLSIELNVSKNVNSIQLDTLRKHLQDSAMIMKNLKDNTIFENLLYLHKTARKNSNEVVTDINSVKNVTESSECL